MLNTWEEKWQKALDSSSGKKGWKLFDDRDFASFYEMQLLSNGYPGILLDRVSSLLDEKSTLIDIGAGTGAFTVPLSRKIKEVTAVEPSSAMSYFLRKKINKNGNINLISKRWEDIGENEIKAHDIILAVNSLYCVMDIKNALQKMLYLTKKYLFIITGIKSGFYCNIWKEFKDKPYCRPRSWYYLYNLLAELGIKPGIEIIRSKHSSFYNDIDQAYNYWSFRLDLAPCQHDDLLKYLKNNLAYKNSKLFYEEEVSYAIILHEKNAKFYS